MNWKDYSPTELLSMSRVDPRVDGGDVSIGMALDHLVRVSTLPGTEFQGGNDGIDALCYHLNGGTCQRAIDALNKVLQRFRDDENQ